jgi:hypothetical protein
MGHSLDAVAALAISKSPRVAARRVDRHNRGGPFTCESRQQ